MDRRGRARRVDDLMHDLPLSCIDGRHASCVVGAPGGNAGELVVLLTAAEHVLGAPVDVAATFDAYLERFGRFYLHSDTHAASRLVHDAASAIGAQLPVPPPRAALEDLLRRAPPSWQPALLDLLVDPDRVGCGHLAAMLRDPATYRVRAPLVGDVLRAFFTAMWRGEPDPVFVVLDGAHDERAVVIFEAPDLLDPTTSLTPSCPERFAHQAFVYHAAAVRFTRRRAARWLVERLRGRPDTALTEALVAAMRDLGDHQLGVTLATLAPTLPRLLVDPSGAVRPLA